MVDSPLYRLFYLFCLNPLVKNIYTIPHLQYSFLCKTHGFCSKTQNSVLASVLKIHLQPCQSYWMFSGAAIESQGLQMNPQDKISFNLACMHTFINEYTRCNPFLGQEDRLSNCHWLLHVIVVQCCGIFQCIASDFRIVIMHIQQYCTTKQ